MDIKNDYTSVLARNQELLDEIKGAHQKNRELQQENAALRPEIEILKSQGPVKTNSISQTNSVSPVSSSYEEIERRRSIVILGIPENFQCPSSLKVVHDLSFLRGIFDFLQIECHPVSIYRVGRVISGRSRLLKVVLPSSFFAGLIIRRAPKLRTFSFRGIYIRPSLTISERERSRANRSSNNSHSDRSHVVSLQPAPAQVTPPNVVPASQPSVSIPPNTGNA